MTHLTPINIRRSMSMRDKLGDATRQAVESAFSREKLDTESTTAWRLDLLTPDGYITRPFSVGQGPLKSVFGQPVLYPQQRPTSVMKCSYVTAHTEPTENCPCGIYAVDTHESIAKEDIRSSQGTNLWSFKHPPFVISQVSLLGPLFAHTEENNPEGTIVGSASIYKNIYIPSQRSDVFANYESTQQQFRFKLHTLENLAPVWRKRLDPRKANQI